MNLVIVESPTKAKTLSRFLGKEYAVEASMGHIADLPKKEFGINVENNFEPKYEQTAKSKKIISTIRKKAKEAEKIYLATDPDREGEAIAWHALNAISEGKARSVERVVFHEITKEAVSEAFAHTRGLDRNLVDSQQARRILDRIVGYKLSPLLWKKIRYGLSAGRVQSVAVRLVVEREEERKAFAPEEFWTIIGSFKTEKGELFSATLSEIKKKKARIKSGGEAEKIVSALRQEGSFSVSSVESKEKKRYPFPPFTTSTLQQAASNRLGFTAKRTMASAQRLFEAGVITYHRTDSLTLSNSFTSEARVFLSKEFGVSYVPEKPNHYKTRSRNAQEAHEAIRPTNAFLKALGSEFSSDDKKIYDLIWKRAISSQMLPAVFDQTSVLVASESGDFVFKSTGSLLKFDGWLTLYGKEDENGKEGALPHLSPSKKVSLTDLSPEQHFTEPPPRYTEASLIKSLEEYGVGRPSTYAPILSTIQDRGYVVKEGKYLVPQDVGVVVTRLLSSNFPEVVDYNFTAQVEEELDKVARGEEEWVPLIRKFYGPFIKEVEDKEGSLNKSDFTILSRTDEKCPECGRNLVVKLARYGRFLSCSGFPECKFAKPLSVVNGVEVDQSQLGVCPECGGNLTLREGRYGKFVACGNYPKCKFSKPYLEKIGMKCPRCEEGEVVVKKGGRFKRVFYGCSRYPKCKFVTSKDPSKRKDEEVKAGEPPYEESPAETVSS